METDQSEDAAMPDVTPRAVALGNHLILENILRHLSTDNLRTLQLVNKLWNRVTSTVLKKERRLKARFNYKTSREFIRSCAATRANLATVYELDFGDIVPWRYKDLEDCKANIDALNSLIAEDPTGNLATGVILKINHWKLVPETETRAYYSVLETASCRMRNLVTLTLDLTEYFHDLMEIEQGRYFRNVHLLNLEQVAFLLKSCLLENPPYKPICKIVMNAAPNLKVIKGTSLSCIWDAILECGKAACVKSYTVEQREPVWSPANMQTMLRGIDSLIEHAPALELIKLQNLLFMDNSLLVEKREVEEAWSAIRRLLFHYRKSLRYIRTVQLSFLNCLMGREDAFPVFENLEFLSFSSPRKLHQLLPCVSLAKNQFPRLTHVKLELQGLTGDCLHKYFPRGIGDDVHHWSLPTVRKLELSDRYDKRGMETLSQLFPNVKNIKFYQIIGEYTHSWQNGLWNVPPSVEWLTLHFVAMSYKKKLDNLDELFTGIRRTTLEKLPRNAIQSAYLLWNESMFLLCEEIDLT